MNVTAEMYWMTWRHLILQTCGQLDSKPEKKYRIYTAYIWMYWCFTPIQRVSLTTKVYLLYNYAPPINNWLNRNLVTRHQESQWLVLVAVWNWEQCVNIVYSPAVLCDLMLSPPCPHMNPYMCFAAAAASAAAISERQREGGRGWTNRYHN